MIALTVSFKIQPVILTAKHAQTAGETRYKDQQVATLCHQARTLQTERLIRAHWVTLVLERILLLRLAQKESTLLLEVPLHASSVLLESTRPPMEPMNAPCVKTTSINLMLGRQRVSLCYQATIELVRQHKSTVRQENLASVV